MQKHYTLSSGLLSGFMLFLALTSLKGQQLSPETNMQTHYMPQVVTTNEHSSLPGKTLRGTAMVTVLANEYLFPYDISTDGSYIAISGFGDNSASYWWSEEEGSIMFLGAPYGISDGGLIGGYWANPDYQVNGLDVNTAGTWSAETESWTFLGFNPYYPDMLFNDYSSGWGIDAAGEMVVGMQFGEGYSYEAFKWTATGGYEMLGDPASNGSRPNGISRVGEVVYGWADINGMGRSPLIWANEEYHYIDAFSPGEASAASYDGTYVVGSLGVEAFIWENGGDVTIFANSLNSGSMWTTLVMEDATVIGYTNENWPPFPDTREAFVRHPDGAMETFNDYAEARGMTDAQEWTFFSINDATPDGKKFIGAGINPQGIYQSFLIHFLDDAAMVAVNPQSLEYTIEQGQQANSTLNLANTGTITLNYSVAISFEDESDWLSVNPVAGVVGAGQSINMLVGYDAEALMPGTYEATVTISSNANNAPELDVAVSLIVEETCVAPFNLMGSIDANNPNLIHLSWEHPELENRTFAGFNIYKEGQLLEAEWPENNFEYTEMQINNHCFTVSAVYTECGESEESDEACVDIMVATKELSTEMFAIYPNPAHGDVSLKSEQAVLQLEIYNSMGKVVYYSSKVFDGIKTIPLQGFKAGVYLMRVELEKTGWVSRSLVVN